MERKNCWERMACGREPGGAKADELGVCPAATERRLDGIHGGVNGGRACWVAAGSLSDDPECPHARDKDCVNCAFYRSVLEEEAPHIVYTPAIKSLLKSEESAHEWLGRLKERE
ncbi:MAG: hypothetical protein Kow0056_05460 [Coriobacteriia bacterium]